MCIECSTGSLTTDTTEVAKTLNHPASALDHRNNEPGQVQHHGEKNHNPVLDGVAPKDMTLPERNLLVYRCGGSNLGNAVLELAFSAEVVTPDRSDVAQHRWSDASTNDVVVALSIEVVRFDLGMPSKIIIGKLIADRDQCADDDEDNEWIGHVRKPESHCEMKRQGDVE